MVEPSMEERINQVMKKLLALTVCFVFVGVASGQDDSVSFVDSIPKSSFDIGPEIFNHKYTEELGGSKFIEESGVLYGVYFSYTYRDWITAVWEKDRPTNGWTFIAEGSFSTGTVDYDGGFSDGTPVTISDIDDYLYEIRLLGGWDSLKGPDWLDTIYAGIGYRYLNDDLSTHPAGFERESEYLYIPIGLRAIHETGGGWWQGHTVEFDWFLTGEQTSHLSDVGPPDITTRQKDGWGMRFSYVFQKKSEGTDLIIEPFFRFWHIERSTVAFDPLLSIFGFEPENETTEFGVRVLWRF